MIFIYKGKNDHVKNSVSLANNIKDEVFSELENRTEPFAKSNPPINGKDLVGLFMSVLGVETLEVKTYWYWSRNVLGKFDLANPNVIWLNTRALNRSRPSIVSTLWHEATHFVDGFLNLFEFGHGKGRTANFYYEWKEDCAPFYVDGVAEYVARERLDKNRGWNLLDPSPPDNTKIKTYNPLWKRIFLFWRYL